MISSDVKTSSAIALQKILNNDNFTFTSNNTNHINSSHFVEKKSLKFGSS